MADKKHILTYAGLKKYEDELQDLKVNRRREIAQKIKEAREQGDLSENAEYDAAKDEQRDIELRIEELDQRRMYRKGLRCRFRRGDGIQARWFHRGKQP